MLENVFSIFRQKGCYNKNPIRSSCIFSLCFSTATNCESLQDTNSSSYQNDIALKLKALSIDFNKITNLLDIFKNILKKFSIKKKFDSN